MAKLAFVSDLHWEAQRSEPLDKQAMDGVDALLVLGDVLGHHAQGVAKKDDSAVKRLSQWWDGPTFLVPGNHEFEGTLVDRELRRLRKHAQGTNVDILYQDEVVIGQGADAVRILGTTLWTDFCLHGQQRQQESFNKARSRFGDFNSRREDGSFLDLQDVVKEHQAARAWLELMLSQGQLPTVVATHFAPHPGSIAPRWRKDEPTGAWFVNRLPDELVGKPLAWIHGHTHDYLDYQVGAGRVMCNPSGFVDLVELDELNDVSRKLMLDRHPELAILGHITLREVPQFKGPRILDIQGGKIMSPTPITPTH
jgi:Icc-related predicted phosphoesterase